MRHFYIFLYLLGTLGCLTLMPACSSDNDDEPGNDNPSETITDDEKLNKMVYEFLGKYYLWNDEYKAPSLDYTKEHKQFFRDGLMNL